MENNEKTIIDCNIKWCDISTRLMSNCKYASEDRKTDKNLLYKRLCHLEEILTKEKYI